MFHNDCTLYCTAPVCKCYRRRLAPPGLELAAAAAAAAQARAPQRLGGDYDVSDVTQCPSAGSSPGLVTVTHSSRRPRRPPAAGPCRARRIQGTERILLELELERLWPRPLRPGHPRRPARAGGPGGCTTGSRDSERRAGPRSVRVRRSPSRPIGSLSASGSPPAIAQGLSDYHDSVGPGPDIRVPSTGRR